MWVPFADVWSHVPRFQASISTDANLRIYTSISPTSTDWQLTHSISVPSLITTTSSNGDDNPSGSGSGGAGAANGQNPSSSQAQPPHSQSPATSGSVSGGSGFQQSINGSMGGSGGGGSGSVAGGAGSAMGLINPGKGNEALGGWTVSWCKEKWWGSVLAVSSGHSGIIKVS